MHYNEKNNQWLSDEADRTFSDNMRAVLVSKGTLKIDSGTVMVFCSKSNRPLMMFQTLEPIMLVDMRTSDSTLIGIEPGSILHLTSVTVKSPATTFKNCRMPTFSEFITYEKSKLV